MLEAIEHPLRGGCEKMQIRNVGKRVAEPGAERMEQGGLSATVWSDNQADAKLVQTTSDFAQSSVRVFFTPIGSEAIIDRAGANKSRTKRIRLVACDPFRRDH
jgi:hypothetical protein